MALEWLAINKEVPSHAMAFVRGKIDDVATLVLDLPRSYKIVLVGTGAVVYLYWYAKRTHGYFSDLGIPGPNPGLLGSIMDYQQGISQFDQKVMTKYGKVVGIFHARKPIYLVSDTDIIKQIMVKDFNNFINRNVKYNIPADPVIKDSLLMMHDDHWKFMRAILSPTFTSGRIKEMIPLMQGHVDSLVDNMWKMSGEGTKSFKMMRLIEMFAMDVIASAAFGVDVNCQKDPDGVFTQMSRKLVAPSTKSVIVIILCTLFPFMTRVVEVLGFRFLDKNTADFFLNTVQGAIQQKKEDGYIRKDFLQLMLDSNKLEMDKDDDEYDTSQEFERSTRRGLTDEEILCNAVTFLIAGYETTTIALTFTAYNLATNPECQEKLIAEIDNVCRGEKPNYDHVSNMKYLEYVFLESLRLFSPAMRTSRVAKEDIKINGILFKKDVEIHIPITAIHRDPDNWPEPDLFDPERFLPENRPDNFNYTFLAFGTGPRNCIGMRLALMEAKLALVGILQNYRFKPAPETKIPPEIQEKKMKPKDEMVLMIEKR